MGNKFSPLDSNRNKSRINEFFGISNKSVAFEFTPIVNYRDSFKKLESLAASKDGNKAL